MSKNAWILVTNCGALPAYFQHDKSAVEIRLEPGESQVITLLGVSPEEAHNTYSLNTPYSARKVAERDAEV